MKKWCLAIVGVYTFTFFSCRSERPITGMYYKSKHMGNVLTRPVIRILWGPTFVFGEWLELKQDQTFHSHSSTSCLSYSLEGQWELKGDTLFLSGFDSLSHFTITEQLLVDGNQLRPITNTNFSLTLKKIRNEP